MKKLVFTALGFLLLSVSFSQTEIIDEIVVEIADGFEEEHIYKVNEEYFLIQSVSESSSGGKKEWKFDFYNQNLELEKTISYFFKPSQFNALNGLQIIENTVVCVFSIKGEKAIFTINCNDFSTNEIPLEFEKGLSGYYGYFEKNINSKYIVFDASKNGINNILCFVDWKTGEYIVSKPILYPEEKPKDISIDEIVIIENSEEVAAFVKMKKHYALAIYKTPGSEPEIYDILDIKNKYRDEKVIKLDSNSYFISAEQYHYMKGIRLSQILCKISDGNIIYNFHEEFEDIFSQLNDIDYNEIASQYDMSKSSIKTLKKDEFKYKVINAFSYGQNEIILTETFISKTASYGQEIVISHRGYCFLFFWILDEDGNIKEVITTPSYKIAKMFIEKEFKNNIDIIDRQDNLIKLRYFNDNKIVTSDYNLTTHKFENIKSSERINISIKPTKFNPMGKFSTLGYWYPNHILACEHKHKWNEKNSYVIRLIKYQ
jgi:hypothetical protein